MKLIESDELLSKYAFSDSIKTQIKNICRYNNYSGVIALLISIAIIIFAIYLSEVNTYWYPLTILLIGSRQRALATLLHEAAHRTLAKNKTLNSILGTYFSGYLIFQTFDSYQKSHVVNHHGKLGSVKSDPDYKYYIKSGIFENSSKYKFIYKFLVKPLLCLNVHKTVRYLLVNRLIGTEHKGELYKLIITVALFALLGSYMIGWKFMLVYWLIPYFTVFQIITWFIELAEHYPLVKYAKYDLDATRNRFSHPLEAFFTSMHGENFHLIHHLFPGVPFWKMKQAHEILLQDTEYASRNASFGGILFSGNYVKSHWQKIISTLV